MKNLCSPEIEKWRVPPSRRRNPRRPAPILRRVQCWPAAKGSDQRHMVACDRRSAGAKRRMIHVTTHAAQRFIERVAACTLDQAREHILSHAKAIQAAADFGCEVVRCA